MNQPVIIGGTGGSGTRVVQHILTEAGFFMGTNLNDARDAMHFEPFLRNTIPTVLEHTRKANYSLSELPREFAQRKLQRLSFLVEEFKKSMPAETTRWGWKNPRWIYLIPFLRELFPGFTFIHMLRDGRDMALSRNQNQVRLFYNNFFAEKLPENIPIASVRMWNAVNTQAAELAADDFHYVRVRYEDFYQDDLSGNSVLTYFGISPELAKPLIRPSSSIGRWKNAPLALQEKLNSIAKPGLDFFGYP